MPKRIATLMLIVDLPDDHKQHRITADLGEIGEIAVKNFAEKHKDAKVTMTCVATTKKDPKPANAQAATKASDAAPANAAPAVEPAAELPAEPATPAADAVRQATSGSRPKVAAE